MAVAVSYEYEALDLQGRHRGWFGDGAFPAVRHWSVEWSRDAPVHMRGSCDILADTDFAQLIMQVWRTTWTWWGKKVEPRGALLMESPKWVEDVNWIGGRRGVGERYVRKVDLWSTERLLQRTTTDRPWTKPAGTLYVDAIRELVEPIVGRDRVSITPSDARMPGPWFFEEGTTILRIVSGMCELLGYRAPFSDLTGRIIFEPYVRPKDRPIKYRWEQGSSDWYKTGVEIEDDGWRIPNQLTGYTMTTPPLVYTAKRQTGGEYSIDYRHFVQAGEPIQVDTDSPTVLRDTVERTLAVQMQHARKITLTVLADDVEGFEHVLVNHGTLRNVHGVVVSYLESSLPGMHIQPTVEEIVT